MEKMSHETISAVYEVEALMDYLENSLSHCSHLIGSFMRFDTDENDNVITNTSLNLEALDELLFQTRKISSKSDILQNKVAELKKAICK